MDLNKPASTSEIEPCIDSGIALGGQLYARIGDQLHDMDLFSEADGYASFHDADTAAEVDAAFRSQRRIAIGYFVVFLAGVLGVALGTVFSSWATEGRVFGGFSPSFLMTGVGLYVFFLAVGAAAASLANGVDDRMLGASSIPPPKQPSRPRQTGSRATRSPTTKSPTTKSSTMGREDGR